jgi:hypothetical protein
VTIPQLLSSFAAILLNKTASKTVPDKNLKVITVPIL